MRRAAAILAIGVGVTLVVFPLAFSLFGRTADAERILDRFTFLTLEDNPERYLAEAEVTRAGSSQLVAEAVPALAADAGVREAELETRFPALATAQSEVPEAEEFSIRYSEQLEAVEDKFHSVYDTPVSWLPLTATPWLFLIGGGLCIAFGGAALRGGGRGPLVALLGLGLALLLGPPALGAVGKSADGEDVKDFAERGLTDGAATAALEASTALDEVVGETEAETIPFLAAQGGGTPEQLRTQLDQRFPEAGALLAEWPVIGPRLARLAGAVDESVEEFDSAQKLPIAAPVWFLLLSGAALALVAGLALRDTGER